LTWRPLELILQNYNECLHFAHDYPELSTSCRHERREYLIEGPFLGALGSKARRSADDDPARPARCHSAASPPRIKRRSPFIYALFPTMMLSLHPTTAVFSTRWPVGRCSTVVCEWW